MRPWPTNQPLKFDSFLRLSGAVDKDIMNNASQLSKLLKYLSSLQTAMSEVPSKAEAKLLTNVSDLTSYYEKLSQPPINLKPSALKNELNAALHLVTFLRRSRDLLSTDRPLDGLPFDIEHVKRQTKDQKLVSDVEAVVQKYNGSHVCCHDVKEYNLLMRYLIGIVIFNHFQRPSVAENLAIDEFVRAKQVKDGQFIVHVSEHKTGAQGPAQLALEPAQHKLFQLFAKR